MPWTCQRQSKGVKCRHKNPSRKQKCEVCGKHRPKRKRPAHQEALKLPYSEFLRLNGGAERCAICGAEPKNRRLHRDHDHRTGKPRGLLCFPCNSALRPYMTAEWLRATLTYVERTEKDQDNVRPTHNV